MRLHPASRVAEYCHAGWWHDTPVWTWGGLLRARVVERPDTVAVVDPADRPALLGTPARRWTWARLDAEVDRFAALLAARGVRPDAVVGTVLPHTVEQVVTVLACARLGAIVSPFPTAYRPAELVRLGAVAGLAALVTVGTLGGRNLAVEAREAADRLGNDVAVLAWAAPRERLPAGVEDAGGTTVEGSVVLPRPGHRAHPADVVTLSWTSGTEAAPKGVPRCANTWTAIGQGCAAATHLTGDDVLLGAIPAADVIGIGSVLVPWLLTGARLVLHHPSDLPTVLDRIATDRVTVAVVPPALLRDPQLLDGADLSSLRVIGTGGAPVSGAMVEPWRRRGVEIMSLFASHEGLALVADRASVPDPAAGAFPWFGRRGLRWANPASAGLRSRLVDPRSGAEVTEPGRPGELRVTGPTIFAGYWGGGGDPFDEHGWFRTGDVFVIDESDPRLLRHVDRAGDLVTRRGVTVSPSELEGLIATHPAVAQVAVVGVSDGRLGELVAAVVVPAADVAPPTLDDLVAHLLGQRVAAHKLPERLRLVDALPRSALGKLLRRRLRRQLSGV